MVMSIYRDYLIQRLSFMLGTPSLLTKVVHTILPLADTTN